MSTASKAKRTDEHRAEMAARKARRDADGKRLVEAHQGGNACLRIDRPQAGHSYVSMYSAPISLPRAEPKRPRIRMAVEVDAIRELPEGAQILEVPHPDGTTRKVIIVGDTSPVALAEALQRGPRHTWPESEQS